MGANISNNEFLDYIMDILSPLCTIKARKMFGGYGLYVDNKIFALIAKQELYFKANNQASEFFMQFDSEPFSYERNGKTITMSYWKVSSEILENEELLKQWLMLSLA